ncbi:MAG: STAS domain-containing protein [Micromonosporaceae bacterium]
MGRNAGDQRAGGDERVKILHVRGELDLATADGLYRRGETAIRGEARLLLLDLTNMTFCDSRGLSAFVRIANDADAAGCRYGLVAPQPLVLKVLRITGLDRRLPVFATIEEARFRLAAAARDGAPKLLTAASRA